MHVPTTVGDQVDHDPLMQLTRGRPGTWGQMKIADRVASNDQSRFRAARARAVVPGAAAAYLLGSVSLAQAVSPSYSVRGVSWSGPMQPRMRAVLAGWVARQLDHKRDLESRSGRYDWQWNTAN